MSRYVFALIVECDGREKAVLDAMYAAMTEQVAHSHVLRSKVIEIALADDVPGEPTVVLMGAL